jgi:hypothetical protein
MKPMNIPKYVRSLARSSSRLHRDEGPDPALANVIRLA